MARTIVTGEFLDDFAVLNKKCCGHITCRKLGAIERVEIADGKLCLALKLILPKGRRKFCGVTAASPICSEINDGLSSSRKESFQLCPRVDFGDGAIFKHLR